MEKEFENVKDKNNEVDVFGAAIGVAKDLLGCVNKEVVNHAYILKADFPSTVSLKAKLPKELQAGIDGLAEGELSYLGKNSKIPVKDLIVALAVKNFLDEFKNSKEIEDIMCFDNSDDSEDLEDSEDSEDLGVTRE